MSNSVAAVDGDAETSATRVLGTHGKEDDEKRLRQKVLIPEHLRSGMVVAMQARDPDLGAKVAQNVREALHVEVVEPPEAPVVVFVNPRSGGHRGHHVKCLLQELIGEDQVLDLSVTNPFIEYGLTCLEILGCQGDDAAKDVRNKLRVMVAGGDGTIGQILQSLEKLVQKRQPVPATGIIPLGTGNDLSRSFGWGGSLPHAWRSKLKDFLHKATSNPVKLLDSWHIRIVMEQMEPRELPLSFKTLEKYIIQDADIGDKLPENPYYTDGVFYNYFSIGMDAQIAHAFHHLRNKKPNHARSTISNKLIYARYSCKQGWFCTPCVKTAGSWELRDILSLYTRKINRKNWDEISIPPSIRAIVFLNLDSYGGGSHPWGHPKPEYMEKRKLYAARSDDGWLEIFGLKQGWHASCVMSNIISAKHIGQAAEIKLVLRSEKWKEASMQMDREPGKVKLPTNKKWKGAYKKWKEAYMQMGRKPGKAKLPINKKSNEAYTQIDGKPGKVKPPTNKKWKEAYMQMDGEPWKVKLPTNEENAIVLTIKHVDVQARIISGKIGESEQSEE